MPGGIGLAPRMFEARDELVRRARELIEGCSCGIGCPACIGPTIGDEPLPGADTPVEVEAPELSALPRRRVALELLHALGVAAVH